MKIERGAEKRKRGSESRMPSHSQSEDPLRYLPFTSQIDLNFWHKLSTKKLNELKLSEEPVKFRAEYDINHNIPRAIASIGYNALREENYPQLSLRGVLFNKNSIESFKRCDKNNLVKEAVIKMVEAIISGEALRHPSEHLCPIILLSFADLKKFDYVYWCAFPALGLPPQVKFTQVDPLRLINDDDFNEDKMNRIAGISEGKMFVLLDRITLEELPLEEVRRKCSTHVYVVFADPSGDANFPGWPLRGLILTIAYHMPEIANSEHTGVYTVISLRGSRIHNYNKSRIFRVRLQKVSLDSEFMSLSKFVGWEENQQGENKPRRLNLSSSMDPKMLAESAVDLNLKLMRWRLAPDINLECVSKTKCLLLGSGTLGCNVARSLLGWGVRRITFVDSGDVSYSNPVRQSLFTFDDSLNGGRPKAEAAAESCKKIFPGVDARHVRMKIPMPGHGSVTPEYKKETSEAIKQLEDLIEDHDAIFLLLDTREARWLPTLFGAAKKKIVINAALGFDTFLVMRHGVGGSNELGCYFCNDVVAPTNSTRDRSLDQQCTVSRPGISQMAAGFATELMVSLLSHPKRNDAPAESPVEQIGDPEGCATDLVGTALNNSSVLGPVPHQIRYFLSRYHFMTPNSTAFYMCTACSPKVVSEYMSSGFDFIFKALTEENFLEKFTGLADMHAITKDIDIIALGDSDNESSMSNGSLLG
ncbi:ubiquitin-like modifier-activating enzyme ATG7 isoform X1 [Varroa jacobsoni]|uniref:Ubiquitin-like modifier-activating enzyme ATG7 n=1 Tax=Varroa destructor TaxID=109461 RepID=A0A7M7JJI8_VARDE|nr:ubiquitin-like modifier-activating enzyme ATG7 isoform X2 [Varroa destructor]XP_022705140.1 ubiquitin-like modifier-activating enzyme ATG7 isoform X1 [Varroa jacobsoni]